MTKLKYSDKNGQEKTEQGCVGSNTVTGELCFETDKTDSFSADVADQDSKHKRCACKGDLCNDPEALNGREEIGIMNRIYVVVIN